MTAAAVLAEWGFGDRGSGVDVAAQLWRNGHGQRRCGTNSCHATSIPESRFPSPSPAVGKWYGLTGFPTDSIALGFEFRYNDQCELKAYVYEPVLDFYGLELPGEVTVDSGVCANLEYPFTAAVHGDTIVSTFFPFEAPRIDPKDGQVLWRTDVYGWAWARPLIVSDVIHEAVGGQ